MSNNKKIEEAEFEVVDENKVKEIAKKLANAPITEQKQAIDNLAKQSLITAYKVAAETIEIVKKSNDFTAKGNIKFMELCDKGIETLEASIKNGKVSEEERKDINDKIMEILKMADDSNIKATEYINEGRNQGIKAYWVSVGFGALTLLGLIAKAVVDSAAKKR